MTKFHPLDQAAARVARLTGTPEFTADYLIYLAKQERLGICFEYRGDISVTWEHSPDGSSQEVGTIPFNGIVKLLQRPTTSQVINEFGVLVSILRSDGQIQRTGQPYRLPVPTAHGGYIKPGYKVEGFMDEVEVPRDEWMIHIDDLNQIIAASVQPPPPGAPEEAPKPKARRLTRKPSWETIATPYLQKLYAEGNFKSGSVFYEAAKRRAGEPNSPFKIVDHDLFCTGAGSVAKGTFCKIWKQIRNE